jgi:hypothetical protein
MNDVLKLPQVLAEETATTAAIGKVASPPHHESTSEEFYFWVAPDTLVEKSQIVRTQCKVGDTDLTFYGLIREVYRQSRQTSLGEEYDRLDGNVNYQPPFDSSGFTYAAVTILRTEPPVMAPPKEGSNVFLGGAREAFMAYGADEIENPLAVGLVKNGGAGEIGPGRIDLDYLLGANGGHLNVNGVAGRGTKSSLLLHFNYLLLHEARDQQRKRPSGKRLRIVPIILNVKNFDLFHIDQRSKRFEPAKDAAAWQKLGINDPGPFQNVTFYAPQQAGMEVPIATDRHKWKSDVNAYSWSLKDIIERGLFVYLFAETDRQDANFAALVHDLEGWLTDERTERDGARVRQLARQDGKPQTFDKLLDEVRSWTDGTGGCPFSSKQHHTGTIRKLYRRLFLVLTEGQGALRRKEQHGKPLIVTARDTCDPKVIDLSSLAAVPSLQRFVAATIFNQLKEDRTGRNVQSDLVYVVTLDELNRFAPRGSHDPITALIELVAAEMRSQGIILLGAQQQASLVSERVVENAGVRALGKSGSLELGHQVWRFLSESARRKAALLSQKEKLLIQDSFREPMLVEIPFPPWALREAEADYCGPASNDATEFGDP